MRLLFVSQLFDPEYSIKGLAYLKGLQEAGVEVDVITTFPNYPTGKLFPGYKVRPWAIENHAGIRVIRVWSFISHSKSKPARALSYATFMVASLIAALFNRKPDVLYAYHPQLTIGLMASLFQVIKGVPFVTDVQDLWPDALAATGFHRQGRIYRMINALCNYVYRRSSHIVTLSNGYKEELVRRGVAPEKVTVIYNWHATEGGAYTPKEPSRQLPVNFCYAGNLGKAQALSALIETFSRFPKNSVILTVVGDGVERETLQRFASQLGADNVRFLGYMPSDKLEPVIAESHVLVIHLKNDPLFKITIPSKTQACLSYRKPILIAVGGEANQLIEQAGAGICALPEDVDDIERAVRCLVAAREQWSEMGAAGWEFYNKKMSRASGIDKTLSTFKKIGFN